MFHKINQNVFKFGPVTVIDSAILKPNKFGKKQLSCKVKCEAVEPLKDAAEIALADWKKTKSKAASYATQALYKELPDIEGDDIYVRINFSCKGERTIRVYLADKTEFNRELPHGSEVYVVALLRPYWNNIGDRSNGISFRLRGVLVDSLGATDTDIDVYKVFFGQQAPPCHSESRPANDDFDPFEDGFDGLDDFEDGIDDFESCDDNATFSTDAEIPSRAEIRRMQAETDTGPSEYDKHYGDLYDDFEDD